MERICARRSIPAVLGEQTGEAGRPAERSAWRSGGKSKRNSASGEIGVGETRLDVDAGVLEMGEDFIGKGGEGEKAVAEGGAEEAVEVVRQICLSNEAWAMRRGVGYAAVGKARLRGRVAVGWVDTRSLEVWICEMEEMAGEVGRRNGFYRRSDLGRDESSPESLTGEEEHRALIPCMAVARDILGKNNHVISVIGDGAMTGGMAYEALNNAGYLDSNLIIILNDNRQVSLPTATIDGPATPVGALSKALTKLQASKKLRQLREAAKGLTKQMGGQAHEIAAKVDHCVRGIVGGSGASLFEELGIYYIGPVDGHNVEDLVYLLKQVKAMPAPGPVLIHVVTEKGKGYPPAEIAADKMHGVVKFDARSGKQIKKKTETLSYTQYFADSLIAEAERDDKIIGIHAAMGGGTGLNYFQKRFPDRCFDVGIAEQHAVTFAAGLAAEGLKPFCAIYSSFLQRGYDQVAHDVDLQKLPVRFAIDRAGLVGADGPTHCGAFDTTFMACLPNMVVMAPSNETELMHMVATAAAIDDRPSCFRYPRGNGVGSVLPLHNKGTPLEVGKGTILREGNRVAILGYGTIVQSCMAAAEVLQQYGIQITVADARFCKPLDGELVKQLARQHEILLTVEEGSIGGFSSHVSHFLGLNGLLDGNLKWRAMVLPDRYIDHGSQTDQTQEAGLSWKDIAATVLSVIGKGKDSFQLVNL